MHFRRIDTSSLLNITFHSFLSLCSPPMDSAKTPPRPGVSQEKLRLMCSYGGLFVPRPHDKSLCYVGGDNRILAVHRYSSLSQLCVHLSRTLLLGRPFIIKYHLPADDFDSLISITNDEDLQLMIQEYDRVTASSPLKPSRLRLFLFFYEPDTAISIHDAKQEDTINDSGILVSDDSAVDCSVDCSARPGWPPPNDSGNNFEALAVIHKNKQIMSLADDVNKESDSLVVEISSSGSLSSSPSMSSLPPPRADDSGGGRLKQEQSPMEELLANLNFATTDDGCAVSSAALAPPVLVTGYSTNGVTCDARTSDALCLPSPYSVARIASTSSYSSEPVQLQEHANMRREIQRDGVEEYCGYRITSQVDQYNQNDQFVHHVQQVAIPSQCPVYAIPVVPTRPIRVTPQSGPASTLHNDTAPNPAFQQHYYVAFPQFHGPLRSNIAFTPAHIASPTLWF